MAAALGNPQRREAHLLAVADERLRLLLAEPGNFVVQRVDGGPRSRVDGRNLVIWVVRRGRARGRRRGAPWRRVFSRGRRFLGGRQRLGSADLRHLRAALGVSARHGARQAAGRATCAHAPDSSPRASRRTACQTAWLPSAPSGRAPSRAAPSPPRARRGAARRPH